MSYMDLINQNTTNKDVIDSLGGIDDMLKPLEGSMKKHELRPYTIQVDYQEEIKNIQRAERPRSGLNSVSNFDQAKIVSASPYRAVIQLDNENEEDEDANDFEREDSPRSSPIKGDSELLRS
eukprot:CAMPEP_0176395560 /NCGR_PEP_ID=MMETSP0126-20121128/43505_1 /TAXON_ID=141414 ORGANISM="Strombidinopsis acuminatum, Strain SPMC142" /NCGR_SAMPLE_ID=MMETSP0126 /ASSEMBLY_ACC=CAM_ASM_000229 /LENGTH=121 /DNA_ID=CAMNT_0017768509 /DNA_START=199 /DNA_END=564 /DNA_ORIENTATION=+